MLAGVDTGVMPLWGRVFGLCSCRACCMYRELPNDHERLAAERNWSAAKEFQLNCHNGYIQE